MDSDGMLSRGDMMSAVVDAHAGGVLVLTVA